MFKQYKRISTTEMRPYIKGEDLSNISVSKEDSPETDMGMIARNPNNHKDMWYVSRSYFEENFEPLEGKTVTLEKMKEVVNTKYNTLDILAVLRYGLKNPSDVGIEGIDDIYEDVIEGLYRKIEYDNKKEIKISGL